MTCMCMDKATSLRRLRRWLEIVTDIAQTAPERIDMHRWYGVPKACGTVACAAGHAMLDPEFKNAGLTLDNLKDFFGISEEQADYICFPRYYVPTVFDAREPGLILPSEVIRHIRQIIVDVDRSSLASEE